MGTSFGGTRLEGGWSRGADPGGIPHGACLALRDGCRALSRYRSGHPIHRVTAHRFAELLRTYARLAGGRLDIEVLPAGAVVDGDWVYRTEGREDPIARLAILGVTRLRLAESVGVADLAGFLSRLGQDHGTRGDPRADWLAESTPLRGLELETGTPGRQGAAPARWSEPREGAQGEASPAGDLRRSRARVPHLAPAGPLTHELQQRVAATEREALALPLTAWVFVRAGRGDVADCRRAAAALARLRDGMIERLEARALAWFLDQLDQHPALPGDVAGSLRRGLVDRTDPLWFSAALRALPPPRHCDVAGLLVRLGPDLLARILAAPDVLQCDAAPKLLALLAGSDPGGHGAPDGAGDLDGALANAADRLLTWLDHRGNGADADSEAAGLACLEQMQHLAESIADRIGRLAIHPDIPR